ncbi:hypothetical protein JHK82_016629 [Glycine max]|nr:hypothetical protein JHK85_017057 [Glycine max]KAG5149748.1 hypothetical protein JHK82_016629 [Glycine max]
MVHEYGFSPQVEHYGCLIDLLGRVGMLHEAHKLIDSFTIKGDATAWRTLLSACRIYRDVKLGKCVKDVLKSIYAEHPTDSLLISCMYAVVGRIQLLNGAQNKVPAYLGGISVCVSFVVALVSLGHSWMLS